MTNLLIKNIYSEQLPHIEAILSQNHLEFEVVSEQKIKRQAMRNELDGIAALAPKQASSLNILREDRAR